MKLNGDRLELNMMGLINASVHFTIKDQSIDDVKKAWVKAEVPKIKTVHHCFLSIEKLQEKNIPTDVTEWVESLGDGCDCWFDDTILKGDGKARFAMLDELKELDGQAIFVGAIVEGVKVEYDYAEKIGLNIRHIDL
jgi:hypothetical protein